MSEPIIVDGPDGNEYEFPAGTSHDVINSVLSKRFPKPAPASGPDTGIKSGWDAALFSGVNFMTGGALRRAGNAAFEGTVNEGWGDAAVIESETNYPLASTGGKIAGFAYPAGAAGSAAVDLSSMAAKRVGLDKLLPKGTDVASRLGRYGARLLPMAPAGAIEAAAYNATGEADTKAVLEGREPTLQDRKEGAVDALTNPINYAAIPALSALYRGGRGAITGQFTPDEIVKKTNIPVKITDAIPNADELSRRGQSTLNRLLKDTGVTIDDAFGALRASDLADGSRLPGRDGVAVDLVDQPSSLPARRWTQLVDEFGDKADNLENSLVAQMQGASHISGSKASDITKRAIEEDAVGAKAALKEAGDQFAGTSARRSEARYAALEELNRLSEEGYQPILSAGPQSQEGADALLGVINGPGMQRLLEPMRTLAAGEGVDIDVMMAQRPLEAAHWMQSRARQLTETSDGAMRRAYGNLRTRLLTAINKAAPGYDDVRMQYGDEIGNIEALKFGNRFFAMARDELKTDELREAYEALTPQQRQAAMMSVRDAFVSAANGSKPGLPPRLGQVGAENTLDALETIFGAEGKTLRDSISKIDRRMQNNDIINPRTGSPTAANSVAVQRAIDQTRNPVERIAASVVGAGGKDMALSAIAGQPAPYFLARGAGRAWADRSRDKAVRTLDEVQQFLLSKPPSARAEPPVGPVGPPTAPPSPAPIPPRLIQPIVKGDVDGAVQSLDAARGDREAFNQLVAQLTAPGVMTKTQLDQIAHSYVGGPTRYRNRDAALGAIKGKFSADMLFQSKVGDPTNLQAAPEIGGAMVGAGIGGFTDEDGFSLENGFNPRNAILGALAGAGAGHGVRRVDTHHLKQNPDMTNPRYRKMLARDGVSGPPGRRSFQMSGGDGPRQVEVSIGATEVDRFKADLPEQLRESFPRYYSPRDIARELDDAKSADARARQEGDFEADVLMTVDGQISGGPRLSTRQAKELFNKTFAITEDAILRKKQPYYEFSGAGVGHTRMYIRAVQKLGPPKGYHAFVSDDGIFYFVKHGQVERWKQDRLLENRNLKAFSANGDAIDPANLR